MFRSLYPKLSSGGFAIVDDYGALENCKRATDDCRAANGVTEQLISVDWTCVYWRKR